MLVGSSAVAIVAATLPQPWDIIVGAVITGIAATAAFLDNSLSASQQ